MSFLYILTFSLFIFLFIYGLIYTPLYHFAVLSDMFSNICLIPVIHSTMEERCVHPVILYKHLMKYTTICTSLAIGGWSSISLHVGHTGLFSLNNDAASYPEGPFDASLFQNSTIRRHGSTI